MEGTTKKPLKWYFIVLITLAAAGVIAYFMWPASSAVKANVKYDPLTGKALTATAAFDPLTGAALTA